MINKTKSSEAPLGIYKRKQKEEDFQLAKTNLQYTKGDCLR